MITSIKNADYSFLFREASEELLRLHDAGALKENSLNQVELDYLRPKNEDGSPKLDADGRQIIQPFTSLEQYFTRLGTLVAHADNPIQYLMLPLDEPCLEVNANTRDITIPADFKKYGVSVQGDVIAETLFLRIDRFFDCMDFLETEAYVQWKLKDGTEGASKIPYVDYKSEHSAGKLILVWPLTGAITAQDGNLQFSLRFLKRRGSDITYSWNSLPCTLAIKKALNPDVDYKEFDDASSLFKLAIENSKHTSSGDDVDAPSFTAPGYDFDLDEVAYLTAQNQLLLKGQAWIADQGSLTYNWKYTNLDNTIVENPIPASAAKAAAFELTKDTEPKTNKVYYLRDEDAVPYGYREIPHKDFDEHKAAGLYERYAEYLITAGEGPSAEAPGVVTGTYELEAIHKLGFDSEDAVLKVKVPGPEKLEFVSGEKDENGVAHGLDANGTLISADGELTLSVSVENDDIPSAAYQSMTYSWRKKENPDDDMVAIQTNVYDNTTQGDIGKKNDSITLTNATPGWYEVAVTSMVNRDSKTIDSLVARVTKAPVAPELEFPYDDSNDNVDMLDADKYPDRKVTITIEDKGYDAPLALHTDGLIYEWRVEQVAIAEGTEGFSGLGTKTLTIDGSKFNNQYMNIDCLVSNKLNNAVSEESRSGIYMVSF